MPDRATEITYYGAAAFKIVTAGGKRILIDPYITDNSMCHEHIEDFLDADLILVSHGAFDHLGDTIELMKRSRAVLVCGLDVAELCQKKGIPKERVKLTIYGDQKDIDGIRIKTVDARHASSVADGEKRYYGWPMGYVLTTEDGVRIYHTGDTSLFGDLKLIGMLYRPNILLICISRVTEGYACEMTPTEAALATQWVAPDIAVPMHYPPGSDEPRLFCEAVRVVAPNVQPVIIEPCGRLLFTAHRFEVVNPAE